MGFIRESRNELKTFRENLPSFQVDAQWHLKTRNLTPTSTKPFDILLTFKTIDTLEPGLQLDGKNHIGINAQPHGFTKRYTQKRSFGCSKNE